jgi:SIR2-like domain
MFAVSGAQVGWLLGAGASASGGIPTAGQLLDEFKAVLYASENNLDRNEVRIGDPLVGERVRRFFDNARGLPPIDSPDEYAAAFECAYPDPAVRRQWLDRWIAEGRPSFGHRVLAVLMASGLSRWVATTNFDDLVEHGYEQLRARDDRLPGMTAAAIDSAGRASRALREDDWPLVIKLHGDIKSERLKNTSDELQSQDETLRQALLDASRGYGLAVIGYSGRDSSVMDTLRAALATRDAFPSGLIWLTSNPGAVFPAVTELLREARANGVDARFVESANFDESFGLIARHVDLSQSHSDYLAEGRPTPYVRGVEIDTTQGGQFPALRMNALPLIELPKTAIHLRCKRPIEQRPGLLLKESSVSLFGDFGVASGRDFYGYGLTNIWEQALARYQPEMVEEVEIAVGPEALDPLTIGLLNEAVVRALAWDRPLRARFTSRGHRIVVWPDDSDETKALFEPLVAAYGSALTGTFEGARTWREGVRVRLDWRLDRVWLLFEPWTWVDRPRAGERTDDQPRSRFAPPDAAAAWVKERWATRRNQIWAAAIGAWADILISGEAATVSAPQIDNSRLIAASFTIGKPTAYSLPGAKATGASR